MSQPTLHYIHDPLCGWCYAAGPMVEAAANAGVPVVLHGGSLFDRPTHVDAAKRGYIRQSDARIAEMAGVSFGPAYLDGLLADPAATFWSRPVIAAILAAGSAGDGADLRMLRAIQHAHYVDGRRVVEADVLAELVASIGLDPEAFGRALAGAPADAHIAASRDLMRRAGLHGFPGFLIERADQLARFGHEAFYGHPAGFADAIRASA